MHVIVQRVVLTLNLDLVEGAFGGKKIIWISLMAVNSLSQNFNDPLDNTKQNMKIFFIKKMKQAY